MPRATKALLRRLADRYETAAFSDGDPVSFLHGAGTGAAAETTAFVAACLSYGSRAQFLPKIRWILDTAKGDVHGWIVSGASPAPSAPGMPAVSTASFPSGKCTPSFPSSGISSAATGRSGLSSAPPAPPTARRPCAPSAARSRAVPRPSVPKDCTSACKRLCLFLRWMVRDGSPVDAGLWSGWFDKRTLVVPLDIHVLRQARALELLRCRSATMHAARELTSRLAEVFPSDPCKGDFALFGLGLEGGLPPSRGSI